MTSARVQPFSNEQIIKRGCYDGFRVCPRNITERILALYVLKTHFCLIRESQNITFNQAKKELKLNFKDMDNVLSDKHVKHFIRNEY